MRSVFEENLEEKEKKSNDGKNYVRSTVKTIQGKLSLNFHNIKEEFSEVCKLKAEIWNRFRKCTKRNKKLILLAFGSFSSKIAPEEYGFESIYCSSISSELR